MMTPSTYRRRMQGLTLIETMVAITISLILMAGAITLFINNKVTYQVNDNLSRLQENARFAIDFMLDDLRMVGFLGCSSSSEKVENSFITSGGAVGADEISLADTDDSLEGFDDTSLSPGRPVAIARLPLTFSLKQTHSPFAICRAKVGR